MQTGFRRRIFRAVSQRQVFIFAVWLHLASGSARNCLAAESNLTQAAYLQYLTDVAEGRMGSPTVSAVAPTNAAGEEMAAPAAVQSVIEWTPQPSTCSEFSSGIAHVRATTFSDGTKQSESLSAGYTALGSGLNYQDEDGRWVGSVVEPQVAVGGAVAFGKLAAKYQFAADANLDSVVECRLSSGAVTKSAVAGLSYYDKASGRSVVIANVRHSTVQAFDEGVYYTNAFEDVDADIVYRVRPWGLEQDVVLFGNMPNPSSYGFNPAQTVLCILTELVGLDLVSAGIDRENGVTPAEPSSEPLVVSRNDAGTWRRIHNWQRCYAYAEDGSSLTLAGVGLERGPNQPVAMRVFTAKGKVFLSEEIPVTALSAATSRLFALNSKSHRLAAKLGLLASVPRDRAEKSVARNACAENLSVRATTAYLPRN